MFPARAIEIDKIDNGACQSSSKNQFSHNGERSPISPKRCSPSGHLAISIARRFRRSRTVLKWS
jgi:hypothetical protein